MTTLSGIAIVPLFREKSIGEAPASEKMVRGHSDPLGGAPLKHATGYTWLVRQYLRKDLEGAQVCDIMFEWRKKRRRGSSRSPNTATTPELPLSGRRHTTQVEGGISELSDGGSLSKFGTPSMHLQKPSDDLTSTRTSRSFELSRPTFRLDGDVMTKSPIKSRDLPIDVQEEGTGSTMLTPNRNRSRTTGSSPPAREKGKSSPSRSGSIRGRAGRLGHDDDMEDDGEESDPEDSERPWMWGYFSLPERNVSFSLMIRLKLD